MAPLEAMASGAPVIAFAKGGVLDTMKCINCPKGSISTGLLFKRQQVKDIVEAIKWFEDNKVWKRYNQKILINLHKFQLFKF